MSEIAIVTDSLSSVPANFVEQYNIKVVPQVLIWGEEIFLDGVDITPSEFYNRLKTADTIPSTSQATPASFKEVFEPLVAAGIPIITIVGSSELTATINSAEQAKATFPHSTIEIVDSLDVAMSLGFQVLAVARAIEEGKSFEEVVAIARTARNYTGVMFVVESLEFLHRGGRIGGASRLLGTALGLKPLLELRDGNVEPLENVRTKAKARARMLDLIEERVAGQSNIRLAGLHAAAEEEAQELLKEAEKRLHPVETLFTEVSPVIGTHTGPGVVGLAFSTIL
jgi:DegV family protein with EDD domain